MNDYFVLRCRFPKEDSELIFASFYAIGVESFEVKEEDDYTSVLYYGESDKELLNFRETLRASLEQHGLSSMKLSVSRLQGADWKNDWKKHVPPVHIGKRLRIEASVSSSKDWAAEFEEMRRVMIEPGLSFGTGTHPSTKMCLEVIVDIAEQNDDLSILDVGCGSGVLSLAASILGFSRVLGIDNDPSAVEVALGNAKRNNCKVCEFSGRELADVDECFDVVAANIVSSHLVPLLPLIKKRAKENSRIILSGILAEETEGFLAHFSEAPIRQLNEDSWRAFVFLTSAMPDS